MKQLRASQVLIEEVDGKSAFDHSKVGEILVNLGGLKGRRKESHRSTPK